MSDKLIIMSLSVLPEQQTLLKTSAKKLGVSASQLIRDLVTKYLGLLVNDGSEVPVILKIPSELKGDEEGLRKWMAVRTEAIVAALKSA